MFFKQFFYSTIPAPVPAPYPTDGLIDRWDFDNTLEGVKGNTWNMANTNWEYDSDAKFNYIAATTDTASGRINRSMFNPNGQDFSICGWFYAPTGLRNAVFVGKGDSTARAFIGAAPTAHYDNKNYFNVMGTQLSDSTATNTWFHLVGTFKGASTKAIILYENGVPVQSSTGSTALSDSDPWKIFSPGSGLITSPGGRIALLYIYNKVLTQSEVTQLYNSGNGV